MHSLLHFCSQDMALGDNIEENDVDVRDRSRSRDRDLDGDDGNRGGYGDRNSYADEGDHNDDVNLNFKLYSPNKGEYSEIILRQDRRARESYREKEKEQDGNEVNNLYVTNLSFVVSVHILK